MAFRGRHLALSVNSSFPDVHEPKHHPSDVRFYLAVGVLGFVGLIIAGELLYAFTQGCSNLHATLDDFGLFDAALIAIASAVAAFYFSDRPVSRRAARAAQR